MLQLLNSSQGINMGSNLGKIPAKPGLEDIAEFIFRHLDTASLKAVSQVSKDINGFTRQSFIYRQRLASRMLWMQNRKLPYGAPDVYEPWALDITKSVIATSDVDSMLRLCQFLKGHTQRIKRSMRYHTFDIDLRNKLTLMHHFIDETATVEDFYFLKQFLPTQDLAHCIDHLGNSLLHILAMSGRLDIIKTIENIERLLTMKNFEGQTVLHFACFKGGKTKVLEYFVKRLYEMDLAHLLEDVDKQGRTALHYAAQYGHAESVSLILDYVENQHPRDFNPEGNIPLHLAAISGHADVAREYLLKCNNFEDFNIVCRNTGDSILHIAARWGHTDFIMKLLPVMIEKNPFNVHGKIPVHVAGIFRHAKTASQMLAYVKFDELSEEYIKEVFEDIIESTDESDPFYAHWSSAFDGHFDDVHIVPEPTNFDDYESDNDEFENYRWL